MKIFPLEFCPICEKDLRENIGAKGKFFFI